MTSAPRGVFYPDNPLARILGGPDSEPFDVLVKRAEAAVDALRPESEAALIADLKALIDACEQPEIEIFAMAGDLRVMACHLLENALQAGRRDVARISEGVVDLIEALFTSGVWHTEALLLHTAALKVLASGVRLSEADLARIQEELARLRDAIATPRG